MAQGVTGAELARWEGKLDSFDPAERREAMAGLAAMVQRGEITLPQAGSAINLHCHTFFSYNPYGYSPSKVAWLARKAGLEVAGIVDFDVLDGLDEFVEAGQKLGLKACVGMETRVYVPEFGDQVINSPGEPGVSYHMGVGFPSAGLEGWLGEFLAGLRRTSQQRNRELTARVNEYLRPAALDYDREVQPLTPSGNATERHICLAYARKARELFGDGEELARFWAGKLGTTGEQLDLPEGFGLQALIRAKTMKQGGVGYVQPDRGSFPWMAETNRFLLAAGAIPCHTWLDGTSEGEQRIEELLRVAMSTGVAALNVIPDRNYTPGSPDEKLRNLYQVVALAEELNLIVVAGTEMNSPGHKLVDDFDSAELAPLLPVFSKGAHIVYAHSVLQRAAGCGYTSEWARDRLPQISDRNEFFRTLGSRLRVGEEGGLAELGAHPDPDDILKRVSV
jgi:hypothetical protein